MTVMTERRAEGRGPNLDETAKQIIELLQDDGRLSYSAIAKQVGLSEAAVRHRVQKLIESGVMQVVAVTDPMQVGFARQAMIGIKVSGNVRKVAEELAAMDKLDYIVITTGRFDILAELVAEHRASPAAPAIGRFAPLDPEPGPARVAASKRLEDQPGGDSPS